MLTHFAQRRQPLERLMKADDVITTFCLLWCQTDFRLVRSIGIKKMQRKYFGKLGKILGKKFVSEF